MKEHVIKEVKSGSIAEELEIEAGDVLLTINEEEIEERSLLRSLAWYLPSSRR